MTFKYSICYPDKTEIEYKNIPITKEEVLKIINDYPWKEQLKIFEQLDESKVNYNPSIDITCIQNQP